MNFCDWSHRFISGMLAIVFAGLFAGCTSHIKGWSAESFRSNEFNAETLQIEGIALLPVIMLGTGSEKSESPDGSTPPAPYTPDISDTLSADGNISTASEAYRVVLNEMLTGKIQNRRPSFKLMPPGDVLIRLNRETLACNYSRFSRDYPQIGLSLDQLKCFGDTLQSRYLFIGQGAVFENKTEASLTIVWTFGRKSVNRSVKIHGQLWDTLTGKQIWEGSGVGYYRLSAYEGTPLFEQMASIAVDRLLTTLIP